MIGQEFRGRTGAGNPAGAGRHRFRPGHRRRSAIRYPAGRAGCASRRPGGAARTAPSRRPQPVKRPRWARPGQPVRRPGAALLRWRIRRAGAAVAGRSGRPRGWPSARPGSPFLITEFAALWAAQLLSSAGDQLVQIAVAAGVYRQTGSPLLAALAYAVSYAALLTGGPLLAEVAGLTARRSLLITLAAGRAVLPACWPPPACRWPVTARCWSPPCCWAGHSPPPGPLSCPGSGRPGGWARGQQRERPGRPGAGLPGRRDPAGHGRSRRGPAS